MISGEWLHRFLAAAAYALPLCHNPTSSRQGQKTKRAFEFLNRRTVGAVVFSGGERRYAGLPVMRQSKRWGSSKVDTNGSRPESSRAFGQGFWIRRLVNKARRKSLQAVAGTAIGGSPFREA
jgi:hypothetical protein